MKITEFKKECKIEDCGGIQDHQRFEHPDSIQESCTACGFISSYERVWVMPEKLEIRPELNDEIKAIYAEMKEREERENEFQRICL